MQPCPGSGMQWCLPNRLAAPGRGQLGCLHPRARTSTKQEPCAACSAQSLLRRCSQGAALAARLETELRELGAAELGVKPYKCVPGWAQQPRWAPTDPSPAASIPWKANQGRAPAWVALPKSPHSSWWV